MYSSIVVIYSFPRIPPDHTLSTHESGFFSLLQIQCRITYTKVKNRIVIWYEKMNIKVLWIWKLIIMIITRVYQRITITTTISAEQTIFLVY